MVRVEFSGFIVPDNSGSGDPLTEYFAPGKLCPAGIRHGQVYSVVLDMLPVLCGNDMSERICIIMRYHFRHSGRTGRKIHKHHIVVFGNSPVQIFRRHFNQFSEIGKAFRHIFSDKRSVHANRAKL